jgi:VIT1/CCC1 family predicted Fe2+/Mn2+ transporter
LDRDSVLAAASGSGTNIGAEIGRSEPWHRVCLLMGVAGAGTGERAIIMTGIAGLIGGACSMALGEWLSVSNARELAATQIEREREEIEQTPEEEQRELALILQAKGLPKEPGARRRP